MDGGHHRQSGGAAEHGADQVAPGAVAVDDIVVPVDNLFAQDGDGAENIVTGDDLRGDAQLPGLLGEGALGEAHHVGLDVLLQPLEEGMDVGFGAAGVAAADQDVIQ